MIIDIPEGHTRICGQSQGYLGLPIRDDTIIPPNLGYPVNAMVTRWQLTEEERAAILAGEDIYVRILGDVPPPMMIGVGDPLARRW